MKLICILSLIFTLYIGFLFYTDYSKIIFEEDSPCLDFKWQTYDCVSSLSSERSGLIKPKQGVQGLINHDFLFMISFFLFTFSLCMSARESYSLKKKKSDYSWIYRFLLFLAYLQIAGFVFDFIETSYLENVLHNKLNVIGPIWLTLSTILKFSFGALGLFFGLVFFIYIRYFMSRYDQHFVIRAKEFG